MTNLRLPSLQGEGSVPSSDMSAYKVITFRDREDKLILLGNVLKYYMQGNVLDVGCDQKHLSKIVTGRYIGVDITGKPDVIVNVEHGFPFKDKSFDTVVAFDVLEHIDNLHYAFDELLRVSRRYVIIGLPNMYEWHFRLLFMMGKKLSGKYGLPFGPPCDRHRWLFSYCQARSFVLQRALSEFEVCDEFIGYYSYRQLLPKIITAIGKAFGQNVANLFSYYYCAVLRRKRESSLSSC